MNNDLHWIVVQTKPSIEPVVCQHFDRAGIIYFWPKIKSLIRGRQITRVKGLFPSYVFVHVNPHDANIMHMIRYTRGIRNVLGGAINPIVVPDELIDIIYERVNQDNVLEQGLILKEGDQVRITTGPYADLIGVMDKKVSASGRVRVLLTFLHKNVPCEICASSIEKYTNSK